MARTTKKVETGIFLESNGRYRVPLRGGTKKRYSKTVDTLAEARELRRENLAYVAEIKQSRELAIRDRDALIRASLPPGIYMRRADRFVVKVQRHKTVIQSEHRTEQEARAALAEARAQLGPAVRLGSMASLIVQNIAKLGPATRPQLIERMGLKRSTAISTVGRLIRRGLLHEVNMVVPTSETARSGARMLELGPAPQGTRRLNAVEMRALEISDVLRGGTMTLAQIHRQLPAVKIGTIQKAIHFMLRKNRIHVSEHWHTGRCPLHAYKLGPNPGTPPKLRYQIAAGSTAMAMRAHVGNPFAAAMMGATQ